MVFKSRSTLNEVLLYKTSDIFHGFFLLIFWNLNHFRAFFLQLVCHIFTVHSMSVKVLCAFALNRNSYTLSLLYLPFSFKFSLVLLATQEKSSHKSNWMNRIYYYHCYYYICCPHSHSSICMWARFYLQWKQ